MSSGGTAPAISINNATTSTVGAIECTGDLGIANGGANSCGVDGFQNGLAAFTATTGNIAYSSSATAPGMSVAANAGAGGVGLSFSTGSSTTTSGNFDVNLNSTPQINGIGNSSAN